jgi:hypothetical protein
MGEEKESSKRKEVDRYQYIGFDVYSKKVKEFWKSEQEKKTYLEKTKKGRKREERDHSLVYLNIFSGVDKTILTVSSLLIVLSFFLPWFVLEKGNVAFKYSPLNYIFNFGFLASYSALGGFLAGLFVTLLFVTLILSFVFGIGTLYFLYSKPNPVEKYYGRLKRMLFFNYLPLLLWITVIIISVIGFPSPFGTGFGVKEIGENFSFINFITATSYGMWITLACLVINAWKTTDL